MTPKKAAIYLRTSTDRQFTDNQRPSVIRLAEARGFEVAHIFEEQMSATKTRPQWEALKAAAHRGEFGAVIIYAIDRLGRSMIGNVQEITGAACRYSMGGSPIQTRVSETAVLNR